MNPALSPTTTGFLSSRSARALTSLKTSSEVTTVRMTSTNCITVAGLKKCMPKTREGFLVATASLGDRQRRGVGGEDRVVGNDRVQRREDLLLEGQMLGTASTTSSHSASWARSVA
jgi:hypothetical protein